MPLPLLAQIGIQTGLGVLGGLLSKRPKVSDFVNPDDLRVSGDLGNLQRNAIGRLLTATLGRQRQGIADLQAAGVTGSGLGASLGGTFRASNEAFGTLGAQERDEIIRADVGDNERIARLFSLPSFANESQRKGFIGDAFDTLGQSTASGFASQNFFSTFFPQQAKTKFSPVIAAPTERGFAQEQLQLDALQALMNPPPLKKPKPFVMPRAKVNTI